jgi:hypothetical protein
MLILSARLRLGLPSDLFPSKFFIKILYEFLLSLFVLHALSISFSLAKSSSYAARHYAAVTPFSLLNKKTRVQI